MQPNHHRVGRIIVLNKFVMEVTNDEFMLARTGPLAELLEKLHVVVHKILVF